MGVSMKTTETGRRAERDNLVDNKIKTRSESERGCNSLTRIFLTLPDLMDSMDRDFLIRFGTETLTIEDLNAIGRVQHEVDNIGQELIRKAVMRHQGEGKDKITASRLASAEFAAIFVRGVAFLIKQEAIYA